MIRRTMVLLIDSDSAELEALSSHLHAHEYETFEANDGLSGVRQFFNVRPDIVVIDLDVPDMPGWKVVTRIREMSDAAVLVMASEASNEHVSRAFQMGVAGFLARPFGPEDLVRHLDAIRDRTAESDEKRWVYQSNGLTVDLRSCEVWVDGEPVALTSTEYRLLTYLIERRGWVLSHDQILSHVWGSDYVGEKDQVKLYVWYLRRKIENDPKAPKMIVTKRGLGYTFVG